MIGCMIQLLNSISCTLAVNPVLSSTFATCNSSSQEAHQSLASTFNACGPKRGLVDLLVFRHLVFQLRFDLFINGWPELGHMSRRSLGQTNSPKQAATCEGTHRSPFLLKIKISSAKVQDQSLSEIVSSSW